MAKMNEAAHVADLTLELPNGESLALVVTNNILDFPASEPSLARGSITLACFQTLSAGQYNHLRERVQMLVNDDNFAGLLMTNSGAQAKLDRQIELILNVQYLAHRPSY